MCSLKNYEFVYTLYNFYNGYFVSIWNGNYKQNMDFKILCCNLKDKPGMLFKSTRIYLMHIICLYTHAIDKNMDNNGKH